MDLVKLYPYVVPGGYVEAAGQDDLLLPIGHDVFAMLVVDYGGISGSVLPDELVEAGLTPAEAHQTALNNLESLARSKEIHKALHEGPEGLPFMAWSGHWLAASCIRLPGLFVFASNLLRADTFCVSIPQRGAAPFSPGHAPAARPDARRHSRQRKRR